MKIYTLILFSTLLCLRVNGQGLYLPNGAFEHWHTSGGYEEPDLWTTNNTSSLSMVYRDSLLKYDSSYSVRIEAHGELTSPKVLLTVDWFMVYIKASLVGTDTAYAVSKRYHNGVAIDSVIRQITGSITGWSPIQLFPQNPHTDSAILIIRGGHNAGTTINVDHAGRWVEGVAQLLNGKEVIAAPNPMSNASHILFSNPRHYHYNFRMLDNLGRIVQSQNDNNSEYISISRGALGTGLYFWELKGLETNEVAVGKLVIQ